MENTIKEIIQLIKNGHFTNEENVRLSLVARILKKLGWNIWDPKEVATEFVAVPEDNEKGKVDIALISNFNQPYVYIEIKSLGKLQNRNFEKDEEQLRDYNKNNTAQFAILTDGQIWRLYFPQTSGKFSEKLFKTIDLFKDDIEEIELNFDVFLSKEEVSSGRAKAEAETYLKLNRKQRAMRDELQNAREFALKPPYLNLPNALIECVKKLGISITKEEAENFLKQDTKQKSESQKKIRKTRPASIKPISKPSCDKITFHKPKYFIFLNEQYSVKTWKDVLLNLCVEIALNKPTEINRFEQLSGKKKPYFSENHTILREPRRIQNTKLFVETNLSGKNIIDFCYQILELFDYKKSDFSFSSEPR